MEPSKYCYYYYYYYYYYDYYYHYCYCYSGRHNPSTDLLQLQIATPKVTVACACYKGCGTCGQDRTRQDKTGQDKTTQDHRSRNAPSRARSGRGPGSRPGPFSGGCMGICRGAPSFWPCVSPIGAAQRQRVLFKLAGSVLGSRQYVVYP